MSLQPFPSTIVAAISAAGEGTRQGVTTLFLLGYFHLSVLSGWLASSRKGSTRRRLSSSPPVALQHGS